MRLAPMVAPGRNACLAVVVQEACGAKLTIPPLPQAVFETLNLVWEPSRSRGNPNRSSAALTRSATRTSTACEAVNPQTFHSVRMLNVLNIADSNFKLVLPVAFGS